MEVLGHLCIYKAKVPISIFALLSGMLKEKEIKVPKPGFINEEQTDNIAGKGGIFPSIHQNLIHARNACSKREEKSAPKLPAPQFFFLFFSFYHFTQS